MECNTFWWLCVFIVIDNALSYGENDGVCSELVRRDYTVLEPYEVTYRETYRVTCRLIFTCRKERINSYTSYRKAKKTETKTVQTCCQGYERDDQSSSCKAVCVHTCTNGYCEKPGACACHPGYNQTADPTRCDPVCSPPCNNGRCTGPNICACDYGYSHDNPEKTCQPVCTANHSNAICTAPETYTCLPGFRETSDHGCQPYCSSGCDHGICIQPESCLCNTGYKISKGKCEPICNSCTNGTCVAPEVCHCNPGYREDKDELCQPYCDSCVNGTCVSPGKCTCDKGFVLNSNGTCLPHCKDGCPNGECISPDVCQCRKGYVKVSGLCQPHCDKCVKGKCVAPGECQCLKGYTYAENSTSICVPICLPKCADVEVCTNPNQCACKKGYGRVNGTCEPKCSSCSNGTCKAPEQCSCSRGFENPHLAIDRCVPILCELRCENGTRSCVDQNKCTCVKGYTNESGICLPICKKGCSDNAKCVAPEKCACFEGYESRNSRTCTPICSGDCANGTCIEPDICVCNKGFYMSEEKCVQCDICGRNAHCVGRGKCECVPGYKKSNNSEDCVADCDHGCVGESCKLGCVNGTCVTPGKCVCDTGYIKSVLADNNTYCTEDGSHYQSISTEGGEAKTAEQKNHNEAQSFGRAALVYTGVGLLVLVLLVLVVAASLQRHWLRRAISWYRQRGFRINTGGSEAAYEVSHISDSASTSILYETK